MARPKLGTMRIVRSTISSRRPRTDMPFIFCHIYFFKSRCLRHLENNPLNTHNRVTRQCDIRALDTLKFYVWRFRAFFSSSSRGENEFYFEDRMRELWKLDRNKIGYYRKYDNEPVSMPHAVLAEVSSLL